MQGQWVVPPAEGITAGMGAGTALKCTQAARATRAKAVRTSNGTWQQQCAVVGVVYVTSRVSVSSLGICQLTLLAVGLL